MAKNSQPYCKPVFKVQGNQGAALNLDWVRDLRVNRSAVERRVAALGGRRTVKKEWQLAWLLKAISLIDLTTLAGDDTNGRVRRLCAKAKTPIRNDLIAALEMIQGSLTTAAVCVYHEMLPTARAAIDGTDIELAAVSTGFPAGLSPMELRISEIEQSVAAGATEIDIVISRRHVLQSNWSKLYDEVRRFKDACGAAHMKSILATGELGTLRNIARASMVCMMAGSDFIKTSTGKESENATLATTLVMLRMIREYHQATGFQVGYKPAGGISSAKDALLYLMLLKEELGNDWLRPELFRFGASSLLADIERQIEHGVSGAYSASYRHSLV